MGTSAKTNSGQLGPTLLAVSKNTDIDFYTSDLVLKGVRNTISKISVCIAIDTKAAIEMTLDGSNYYKFNSGQKLNADTWYIFQIYIPSASTLNFRPKANITIRHCSVQENELG